MLELKAFTIKPMQSVEMAKMSQILTLSLNKMLCVTELPLELIPHDVFLFVGR